MREPARFSETSPFPLEKAYFSLRRWCVSFPPPRAARPIFGGYT